MALDRQIAQALGKPYWWRGLIQSEIERIDGVHRTIREHRYKGGPPPKRIYHMQLAHEGRARRYGVQWDIVDLRTVYAHHKGLCGICRESVSLEEFTIDHIEPLSRGGPHVFENLQLAHRDCNSKKRWTDGA